MKDRIRRIMESQHMTQQVFAQFIKISPATLSGIFNGRTNPSLNIVEAIKNSLPSISTDWLLFGNGPMYIDVSKGESVASAGGSADSKEALLDFETPSTAPSIASQTGGFVQGVNSTPKNMEQFVVKNIDKPQRKITEIRIFFDDQTWETFLPKK
ncbi:MAG: helix-turn-helix transcriptional regulator [Prevotella sp.]|jgi:transcriptional regulator with XRE-family HTH domain|nr:helix-turn-helix transcriptional regulator [Prevotella sp.]